MCKRTFSQDLLPEEEALFLQGNSQAAKSEAGDLKEKSEIKLKLKEVAKRKKQGSEKSHPENLLHTLRMSPF